MIIDTQDVTALVSYYSSIEPTIIDDSKSNADVMDSSAVDEDAEDPRTDEDSHISGTKSLILTISSVDIVKLLAIIYHSSVETTKLTTAYGDNADFKETITIKEKKPVNALDAVLDSIKGPKVISTITKSSIDWSNYKEKEGLEDELAVSAKDGYLTRKEFLERCDVRSYENEKTLRMDSSS
eukprot:gene18523-24241_t